MYGPGQSARRAARRFRFAVALAAVLAILQTLGLLHRVAHLGHVQGGGPAAALVGGNAVPREPAPLQGLFSGHVDARDCVLFDSISHADGGCAEAATVAAAAVPLSPQQARAAWHIAALATGFRARAPPRAS